MTAHNPPTQQNPSVSNPSDATKVGVYSGRATPASTAGACGLLRLKRRNSVSYLTWDACLNLAVDAYWLRRPSQPVSRKAAAA